MDIWSYRGCALLGTHGDGHTVRRISGFGVLNSTLHTPSAWIRKEHKCHSVFLRFVDKNTTTLMKSERSLHWTHSLLCRNLTHSHAAAVFMETGWEWTMHESAHMPCTMGGGGGGVEHQYVPWGWVDLDQDS